MTYATGGSGGTLVDLMDALRGFALGQGWTIDKWDSVNRLLFVTKGICTVTMNGTITENVNVYSGINGSGTFAATADHRIRFAMGASNTAALTTYHSHPGSPVTTQTDSDAPYINGMNGPYLAWHFFADATVSDHIHCIVQISAEVFMHFSMGFVDKKGLTHNGVAYVTAAPNAYFRNVSNYTNGTSGSMNTPEYLNFPFCGVANNQTPFQPASYDFSPSMIIKNSNAWPAGWHGPVASATGASPLLGLIHRTVNTSAIYRPEEWPKDVNAGGHLLNLVVQAEAAPYSNIVPLFPVPVFKYHYSSAVGATSRRLCYVGDFPNIRLVNMTNLIPGQEITVGSDTFKCFPVLRQELWANRLLYPLPSSGQFGIAYKKVP
jgi:hypothetical protein